MQICLHMIELYACNLNIFLKMLSFLLIDLISLECIQHQNCQNFIQRIQSNPISGNINILIEIYYIKSHILFYRLDYHVNKQR